MIIPPYYVMHHFYIICQSEYDCKGVTSTLKMIEGEGAFKYI